MIQEAGLARGIGLLRSISDKGIIFAPVGISEAEIGMAASQRAETDVANVFFMAKFYPDNNLVFISCGPAGRGVSTQQHSLNF
ncbi:hypothetical protein [Sphingobium chungbukense]|uniref:Uncharacterized protein n=1 Tax=Sphingobium chungbukense TaxID=56193 RepID=A0A0M3ARM4_9SPHN|nr:hypothetical protein [Sphingobium chungbukense]KKW92857.1 hypothetical protein YP76_08130 [Sphingobium chungbukense]